MNKATAWSKKRLSLIKSLKSIAKRLEPQTTPVHIAELWAYGSFIRPKEEPGDIARAQKQPRESYHDLSSNSTSSTPSTP